MKTTNEFKKTIQAYLETRAKEDSLFAISYAKTGKSLDDCVTYILNTVRESGCNGFADDEIYGMAVHYYDEDEIKAGKPVSCEVVVNHAVEITAADREAAHQAAIKKLQEEAYDSLRKVNKTVKPKKGEGVQQMSLFEV